MSADKPFWLDQPIPSVNAHLIEPNPTVIDPFQTTLSGTKADVMRFIESRTGDIAGDILRDAYDDYIEGMEEGAQP